MKAKLYGSSVLSILLLLIISLASIFNIQSVNRSITSMNNHEELMAAYNDTAFHTVRANAAIRGYMIYNKDQMKANYLSIREEAHAAIERVKQLGGETEAFQEFEQQFKAWEDAIDQEILPLIESGDRAKAVAVSAPILGEGSQKLVVFSKEMANDQNKIITDKMNAIEAEGKRIQILLITLTVLSLLVMIPVTWFVARKLNSNIQSFGSYLNQVAKGDFTSKVAYDQNDEFGQLGKSINAMTDELQDSMRHIVLSSERVAATSEEIAASSNEISHANLQVSESIQEIAADSSKQATEVNEVNTFVVDMLQEINRVTDSIEAFNDSTKNTTRLTESGHNYVDRVMNQIHTISTKTEHITQAIHSLDEKSNRIGEMITLIATIADQTNLLALNASIEAARAGEHGKGFAVVASEVRSLAEQSRSASQQISEIIYQILDETKRAVKEMDDNNRSVQDGRELVDQTGEAFNHIYKAIESISTETDQITDAIIKIKQDAEMFVESMDSIHHISDHSVERVQRVAAASEEQSATLQEITAAVAEMANTAVELRDSLNKFNY
ncbi:methyl-accepting chemotaxis protein [Bacillus ectoiniformans]|uniref:methyl-accepting chemotaxis protein n=1 Tax=Bacillus ectoiniformans TaxID=1494429 RepID=UPI001EF89354|nr:methyl-accepting chemotaxis protein [Bacillus ectoiniformans]